MLIASACDTNEPDIATETPQRLEIRGALNIAFEDSTADIVLNARARDLTLGREQTLQFFLFQTKGEQVHSVRATLDFLIPSDTRFLKPGDYLFEGGDLNARVDYEMRDERRDSTESRTIYRFEGHTITMRIEQADLDGIRGHFSLEAEQTLGERLENGQWQSVQLPNGGMVQVESRFNITDISVR